MFERSALEIVEISSDLGEFTGRVDGGSRDDDGRLCEQRVAQCDITRSHDCRRSSSIRYTSPSFLVSS